MPGIGGSGAVTRSTLRQQLADALRDEVLAGRLQPGQEFTVKEIAEQYGVSATPVREALVDLSAQGLLDAVQHRGFAVRAYSPADHRSMLQARALVTDGIFRRLTATGFDPDADPRTAGTLAGVRRRGEEARRAAAAGDLGILVGYDVRFWRELGGLYGNVHLTDFLHRLRVQTWACTVQLLRRAGAGGGPGAANGPGGPGPANGPGGPGGLGGPGATGAQPDPGRPPGAPVPRDLFWTGYPDLVDALTRCDPAGAHAVVTAYDTHSLALLERLAAVG